MPRTVCAVVVTHNRKILLHRCLRAVFSQTRKPDHVLVVDNASTDGTLEMVRAEFSDVEVLTLSVNLGSAGGFHEGMKRACELGFDWLWLMDDDGVPIDTTLEKLLASSETFWAIGPLVIAEEDPSKTAFSYPIGERRYTDDLTAIFKRYGSIGFVPDYINFYNGVILRREVVQRAGLPEPGLFIWGDETEYYLRLRGRRVKMCTLLSARFLHPKDRQKTKALRLGKRCISFPFSEDPKRFYWIVRNQAFYFKRHLSSTKWLLKTALYSVLFPRNAALIVKASWDGLRGRLSGDRQS